jgi:hypothetical protein
LPHATRGRRLEPQVPIDAGIDDRRRVGHPTPTTAAESAAGSRRWIRRELTNRRAIECVDHQCCGTSERHRVDDATTIRTELGLRHVPRNDAPLDGNRHARTVPALIHWTASIDLAPGDTHDRRRCPMLRFTTMILEVAARADGVGTCVA